MKILIAILFLFSVGFIAVADAVIVQEYTNPDNELYSYKVNQTDSGIKFSVNPNMNSTNWAEIVRERDKPLLEHCFKDHSFILETLTYIENNQSHINYDVKSVTAPIPTEDTTLLFWYIVYCFDDGPREPGYGLTVYNIYYDFDRSDYDDGIIHLRIPEHVDGLNLVYGNITSVYEKMKALQYNSTSLISQYNEQRNVEFNEVNQRYDLLVQNNSTSLSLKQYGEQHDVEINQIEQRYSSLIQNSTAYTTAKQDEIKIAELNPLLILEGNIKHHLDRLVGIYNAIYPGVILPNPE